MLTIRDPKQRGVQPAEPESAAGTGTDTVSDRIDTIPRDLRTLVGSETQISDLKELLLDARAVFEREPSEWISGLRQYFEDHEASLASSPASYPENVRDFLTRYLPEITGILRHEEAAEQSELGGGAGASPIERGLHIIHSISKIIERDTRSRQPELPEMYTVSFSDMQERFPDQIRFSDGKLSVRADTGSEWHEYAVPQSGDLAIKGGLARVAVKVIAGAPGSTLREELPLNDVDVVMKEDSPDGMRAAEALGVTKDGIEVVKDLDFPDLAASRDIDMNSCFLTKDGLVYSMEAFDAAHSGHIRILPAVRGLYGSDSLYDVDGVLLAKDRGMCRLVKVIAEGKAMSFDIPERNLGIDMGIYWLVLAKRFAGKEGADQIFSRMFDVAEQLGRTQPGDRSLFDLLDRVHERYPFVSFSDRQLDDAGVVRWLSGKLAKQIEKLYRQSYGVYEESSLDRKPGDHAPVRIALCDRNETPRNPAFRSEWSAFLERCESRTRNERERIERMTGQD